MAKIYEFPRDRRVVRDARGVLKPAPGPAMPAVSIDVSYHQAAIEEERARKR
jgi:hypothetical protein